MADQKSGRVSLSGLPKRWFLPSFVQIRQRLGQLCLRKPTNGGVPYSNLRVASRPFFFARTALKKGTTSLRSVVKKLNGLSWRKTHSSEGNQTQWTFLKDTSLLLKEKQSCQKNFFFRNSSSFQWSRGKTKHQSQFSWNSNFWGICLFLYCEPALFQYILLPDEADFFSFLLNFKCRQWCFQQVIQLI